MTRSRFIELLNLYLDGELTAEEAASLEEVITSHPEYRRIYTDYCRIHRATVLNYERFRNAVTSIPQDPTLAPPSAERRSGNRWISVAGGTAAAAAVCFLALNFFVFPEPHFGDEAEFGSFSTADTVQMNATYAAPMTGGFGGASLGVHFVPTRDGHFEPVSWNLGHRPSVETNRPSGGESPAWVSSRPVGPLNLGWGGQSLPASLSGSERVFQHRAHPASSQLQPVSFQFQR
ncbi:MAG: hypothetical protein EA425_08715 [Puniceicoccaceae bacterium]|nr:MAG: hypothetical protein EA425_08715 [Puniceicoccaceae bacterium]